MSISFIGVAQATSNVTPVTTLTVTYTPHASGNTIVVAILSNDLTGLTVVDSNSVALTPGPSNTNGAGQYQQLFYYTVPVSIPTSFTAAWTNVSIFDLVVVEYSGVTGINLNFVTNTGSGTSQSISLLTTEANSFLVGWIGAISATLATVTGTQRARNTGGVNRSAFGDNTSAVSSTILSVATTALTTTLWEAVGMELLPMPELTSNAFAPDTDYIWLGGDE